MAKSDELTAEVERILKTTWNVRDGQVIPDTENIALSGGAVKITSTFLYADLAGSSTLAQLCPWETTAKIIRAYLDICSRLIKLHGGVIKSFDGDRVMGVFKTERPNTDAVKCARKIDWMVHNVLNPKARNQFNSIKNNDINIKHCVGIDTSESRAVRGGIRNNNDLIWIGRAPSFAAKLSDIREYPYEVYISKSCFDKMNDDAKTDNKGNPIWETKTVTFGGTEQTVYRTRTPLKP